MSFRYVAGVVGKTVTPSGPYQNSTAPGIWSLAGQGGLGNITQYSSPKQIGSLTTWLTISSGKYYSPLAIKTNGTLWAWGRNTYGQVGQGDTTNRSTPVQIGTLAIWSKIAGCSASNIALKS
jgi:alpha-tubulin suppressor-like RCC1 family protein